MVDIVLLVGKLLLLALLYLFLFAAVRTGMGLVRGAGPGAAKGALTLNIVAGPRELKGTRLSLDAPLVIGRAPGADVVIADDFVSSQHARIVPSAEGAIIEDLGSTNGTLVNGQQIMGPALLSAGDEIEIGTVLMKVGKP